MNSKDTVIFLDVDGVLNHLYVWPRKNHPGITRHEFRHDDGNGGYTVAVYFPDWMPELVQYLVDNYEVHWLTTWRHWANTQLAPILGIPELPVITDGTMRRVVDWKAKAAAPLANDLLAQGKRVIWIEDFYGRIPVHAMPAGVEFVDTGEREGLFGTDIVGLIPEELVEKTSRGLLPISEGYQSSCQECLAPSPHHETWCWESPYREALSF